GPRQLDVLHPEPPVWVAGRVSTEGGDLVDLLPIQHLVDDLEEIEAELARSLFDDQLEIPQFTGEWLRHGSLPLPQEVPDRVHDRLAVGDLRENEVVGLDVRLECAEERPAPRPALHLAIAEEVRHREEAALQQLETPLVIAGAQ